MVTSFCLSLVQVDENGKWIAFLQILIGQEQCVWDSLAIFSPLGSTIDKPEAKVQSKSQIQELGLSLKSYGPPTTHNFWACPYVPADYKSGFWFVIRDSETYEN